MELLDVMQQRYSVRKFDTKNIEEEKLDKILEAGRIAPTACYFQPQRILVIRKKENIDKLKKCTPFTFDAPVILLVCVDKDISWVRKYDKKNHGEIDVSIVTAQMMLEAASIGIGSTWVCSFDPQKVKEEFCLPSNYEPINILPLGYPKKEGKPSEKHYERYELSKTVFYEEF